MLQILAINHHVGVVVVVIIVVVGPSPPFLPPPLWEHISLQVGVQYLPPQLIVICANVYGKVTVAPLLPVCVNFDEGCKGGHVIVIDNNVIVVVVGKIVPPPPSSRGSLRSNTSHPPKSGLLHPRHARLGIRANE
jgi:hypothetical protein